MIVQSQETTGKSLSILDLLGSTAKSKQSGSDTLFSTLLGTITQGKNEDKKIKTALEGFNAVIDAKKSASNETDTAASSSQLLSQTTTDTAAESGLISKTLLSSLSEDEVRSVIQRAKEQLKKEITAKSPEYSAQPESLPKTLSGLIQLADNLGLKPQSLTLSTLVDSGTSTIDAPAQLLSQPLLDLKALSQTQTTEELPELPAAATLARLLEGKKSESGTVTATSSDTSNETATASQTAETVEHQPLKTLLQTLQTQTTAAPEAVTPSETKATELKSTLPAAAKSEGLIALLQGETTSDPDTDTESDASVKTDVSAAKTDTPLLKADSLEVKAKEAQQSMRLFATDLKEAVENYKPPFTRVTMKLNPEKLGEVEVTLVQRGNNVHVNIQSNNTGSVTFLAQNATELKAQLAHQGITNATMNFMAGGEGQSSQQQQQQNAQNRFRAYESFDELELNEEQIEALEIIIPHYA